MDRFETIRPRRDKGTCVHFRSKTTGFLFPSDVRVQNTPVARAGDTSDYCDFISFECKFKWRVSVRGLRRDSDCRTTGLHCGALMCVREQAGATTQKRLRGCLHM
jgi:hypothetical protein